MTTRSVDLNQADWSSLHDLEHCAAHLEAARLSLGSHVPTQVDQVDALVSRLWGLLGFLQSYRNKLVPISKLPPELLSQIMIEYATETNTLFDLKWTSIMRVCHHWHDVAATTQKLWSYIDMNPMWSKSGNVRRVRAQLAHAPSAPLTVKIGFDDYLVHSLALSHVLDPARLRSLEIRGEAKQISTWFKSPGSAFPLLESLQVDKPLHLDALPQGEVVRIPDVLLDSRAPRLRSLKTDSVVLRWDGLHDLRALSVTGNHAGTLSEIVSALVRSPALESLEISAPVGPMEPVSHIAELFNLQSFHLLGDIENCSAVLSALSMSPAASLKIHPLGLWSGAEARDILINIRQHFRSTGARLIRSLKVEATSDVSYFCMTGYTDTALYSMLDRGKSHFLLNSHPPNGNSRRQILTKLLKSLPVEHLTDLDMRSVDAWPPRSWKVTLALLPSLRVVTLGAETPSALSFFDTLLNSLDDYVGGKGYPKLRHVRVDAFMIHNWWKQEDKPRQIEKGKELLSRSFEFLSRLKEIGRPLDVFELIQAWDIIDVSTVKRLYRLVGEKVLQDGHQYIYDPERKKRLYNLRLESVRELRESGMDMPDPEPPSDSP